MGLHSTSALTNLYPWWLVLLFKSMSTQKHHQLLYIRWHRYHWKNLVEEQLATDVRLGVIERVEPNTPYNWCHRAIWTRKVDGSPRHVVDFQSLNKQCVRNTNHTVPPFQEAHMVPPQTYRSVTDAWNSYHSVPVDVTDRVAPQGFLASGDGYTHRYDRIIADIPRKTKCVDDTLLWDESLVEDDRLPRANEKRRDCLKPLKIPVLS